MNRRKERFLDWALSVCIAAGLLWCTLQPFGAVLP